MVRSFCTSWCLLLALMPAVSAQAAGRKNGTPRITVIDHITAKLAKLIDHGRVEVSGFDPAFGDPAPGLEKTLRVDYTVGGVARQKSETGNGKTLLLP